MFYLKLNKKQTHLRLYLFYPVVSKNVKMLKLKLINAHLYTILTQWLHALYYFIPRIMSSTIKNKK